MRRSTLALALVLSACSSTRTNTPVTAPVQPVTAPDNASAAVTAPVRVAVPNPGPARDVRLPPVRATTLTNGLAV